MSGLTAELPGRYLHEIRDTVGSLATHSRCSRGTELLNRVPAEGHTYWYRALGSSRTLPCVDGRAYEPITGRDSPQRSWSAASSLGAGRPRPALHLGAVFRCKGHNRPWVCRSSEGSKRPSTWLTLQEVSAVGILTWMYADLSPRRSHDRHGGLRRDPVVISACFATLHPRSRGAAHLDRVSGKPEPSLTNSPGWAALGSPRWRPVGISGPTPRVRPPLSSVLVWAAPSNDTGVGDLGQDATGTQLPTQPSPRPGPKVCRSVTRTTYDAYAPANWPRVISARAPPTRTFWFWRPIPDGVASSGHAGGATAGGRPYRLPPWRNACRTSEMLSYVVDTVESSALIAPVTALTPAKLNPSGQGVFPETSDGIG